LAQGWNSRLSAPETGLKVFKWAVRAFTFERATAEVLRTMSLDKLVGLQSAVDRFSVQHPQGEDWPGLDLISRLGFTSCPREFILAASDSFSRNCTENKSKLFEFSGLKIN